MKTKFSKKLLSMFLAVLMILSVMSAGFSAYAADYTDDSIEYNALGWAELTDPQLATALLDQVDYLLADVGPDLDDMIGGALGSMWDSGSRQLDVYGLIKLPVRLHSVDELLYTLGEAHNLIHGALNTAIGGDVKNINLSAAQNVRRANGDIQVAQAIFQLIRDNTVPGNSIIKQVLIGKLNLGIFGNFLDGSLYTMLQGALSNIPNGYEENLVNNILVHLVSKAFNAEYQTTKNSSNQTTFQFAEDGKTYTIDEYMFKLLSTNLLQQINIEITYPGGISSRDHYAEIQQYMSDQSCSQADAAKALGYDPGLIYTENGNVYLFRYDKENDGYDGEDDANITITNEDSLFDFAYKALAVAWDTALKPTLGMVDSTTKDFDNNYHDWSVQNDYGWDYQDVASNYEDAQVQAWAAAMEYNLDEVKDELEYNREIVSDPTYSWHDIDSTVLFNELRYSPLMEYYFEAPTGPLNLALECTGISNTEDFMSNHYGEYTTIVGGLNDFLCSLVKDMFPNYEKSLQTIGDTTDGKTIAQALIGNAASIFQWAADQTNKNILSSFYHKNGNSATLSEANFEEAMIPFMISALQNVTLTEQIHDYQWDACKDAEGVAAICLQEYLSYILPDLDYSEAMTKDEDGFYNVTLDGTILPMCRDAVGYVMYQYVPLTDKNGTPWNVYKSKVTDDVTIFDLLNSVIYHYGNEEGVAAMLGLVDESGRCPISLSNTIWQNIDLVANKFFPIIGELQYGTAGHCSSEKLVYKDIVQGVLEIGDTSIHDSGLGGMSNFIYDLVSFISAAPIKDQAADVTVYNFLKDLLNAMFTGRQNHTYQYKDLIPDANATPFDSLVQIDVLGGKNGDSNDVGLLGKALINLCEFTGVAGNNNTLLSGALFLVQAVNSFLHFAPTLDDYNVDSITFNLEDSAITSYNYGNINTNLNVTNAGIGINRAIIDIDGNPDQLGRSFIRIESVAADKGNLVVGYNQDTLIAPAQTLSIPVSGSVDSSYFDKYTHDCVVTYTVKYSIVDSNNHEIAAQYKDLQKEFYQYFTSDQDWFDLTYTEDGKFKDNYTPASSAQTDGNSSFMTGRLSGGANTSYQGHLCMQIPKSVVIKTNDVSQIENNTRVRVASTSRSNTQTINKVYAVANETYSTTAANNNIAVSVDAATGNIINVFYYDYYVQKYDEQGDPIEEGSGWNSEGLDSSALATKRTEITDQGGAITNTRFHIVCEYDKIDSTYGSHIEHKNIDGTVDDMYIPYQQIVNLESDGGYNAKTSASRPSLATGIDGIVFAFEPKSYERNYDDYQSFLAWDGQTQIRPDSVKLNLVVSSAEGEKFFSANDFGFSITVCDNSEVDEINDMYEEGIDFVSNYTAEDFEDVTQGELKMTSETYDYYKNSLSYGLAAVATAVTASNANDVASNKAEFANTETTTSFYGDAAMKPLGQDEEKPLSLIVGTTLNDGFYYQTSYVDKENNPTSATTYANPLYTTKPLTDEDVVGAQSQSINGESYQVGKDKAGADVVKVDGTWYLLNAPVYEKQWVEKGTPAKKPEFMNAPYYEDTKVQATNEYGDPLYAQKTYVYRDEAGLKVTSRDNPSFKLAETNYEIVPGAANRSVYAIARDRLSYAYEITFAEIQAKGADMIYKDVSVVRRGLNNVDFNIVSYENMVNQGQEAEAIVDVDPYYAYEYEDQVIFSSLESEAQEKLDQYNSSHQTSLNLGDLQIGEETVDSAVVTSTSSSFQIIESIRVFNIYLDKVVERGYVGDKLQEEIACAAAGKNHDESECAGTYDTVSVQLADSTYKVNGHTYSADNNPDGVTYTEDSWQNFLVALDAAVNGAKSGNGNYAHKDEAYYKSAEKDTYDLEISDVYTLRTDLMVAENNLTEVVVASEFKVSGQVVVMLDPNNPDNTAGANGMQDVQLLIDGRPVATTDASGNYEFKIASGSYEVTLHHETGYDRVINLEVDGAEVTAKPITFINCDFDQSDEDNKGIININDTSLYEAGLANGDSKYDITRSDGVNINDTAVYEIFVAMSNVRNVYTPVTIK